MGLHWALCTVHQGACARRSDQNESILYAALHGTCNLSSRTLMREVGLKLITSPPMSTSLSLGLSAMQIRPCLSYAKPLSDAVCGTQSGISMLRDFGFGSGGF